MKVAIIVQARMTSTRLPGKVLKEVSGKELLAYQLERLRQVALADEIIIATTVRDSDIPIVEFCKKHQIAYFRGSEEDVLSRYYYAAKESNADVIVRVTSDCPVIDPRIIDKAICLFIENMDTYDYVSNSLEPSYPRGMDVEVCSFEVLAQAFREAADKPDREHVTPFIYMRPERYRLANLHLGQDRSEYRLTVDTMEDYELIKRILQSLYPANPAFSLDDIFELLRKNPEWRLINAEIQQKKYGE
ncbi:glycosyltransferase family protein [Sporomusa sphaeroides]|uniref:cytidylyltransferase domain-containing protein n=1 Tax=Sporomusa sphaeroides TaxID=47679 RepID=UPI003DA1B5ED